MSLASCCIRAHRAAILGTLLLAVFGPTTARADSPYLHGIHFWGLTNPLDDGPCTLFDCPAVGGWVTEVVLTHGEAFAQAPYFVPFYNQLYSQKNVSLITRIDYNWGQTVPAPTTMSAAAWANSHVVPAVSMLAPYAHIWVIGNEPNLYGEGSGWPDNKITPAGYATIYRAVRSAIHSSAPASPAGPHRVLIAPPSPGFINGVHFMHGSQWLGEVLDQIPAAEVDGFAIHAYGGTVTEFHNTYAEQLAVIDAKGHADKPVYMTEWNRLAAVGNATAEAAAADFCRQAFADVHNWNSTPGRHNIICMTWFVYDGGNGTGQWDGYSLEYWKNHGNPYGTSGDLYTAFEQAVDMRYPAGAIGTPPVVMPAAAFTASATSGFAPLTVNFTDQSTGNAATRFWTFGDGQTSTQTNPSHTYSEPGLYTVTLTATNNFGADTETKVGYIAVAGAGGCVPTPITGFETFATGSASVFRLPRFSGTTVGHLAASPNVAVVSEEVTGYDGLKSCRVRWAFVDNSTQRWLRLTTNDAGGLPNPTIDLKRPVRLRLRLEGGSLRVALGVRETGVNVPVGANGGTDGTIEFVGAETFIGGAPQGVLIAPSASWQTVTITPRPGNVLPYTGDGVLAAAHDRGVLEHLALASTGSAGPFTLYIDKIEQPCGPKADFDGDGDVDLSDFGILQTCLGFPSSLITIPGCGAKDLTGDGLVGPADVTAFLGCMTAPTLPADPTCLP